MYETPAAAWPAMAPAGLPCPARDAALQAPGQPGTVRGEQVNALRSALCSAGVTDLGLRVRRRGEHREVRSQLQVSPRAAAEGTEPF